MRRGLALLAAGLLGLTSCVWWTDIEGEVTPTSPKAANCFSNRPTRVESLRPAFRWEPVAEPNVQYDFIIFEAYLFEAIPAALRRLIPGRKVYYREGLAETEHRLDHSLRPKRFYFWSLRVRRAGNVSEWGWVTCDSRTIGGGVRKFPFFTFETPSE